MSKITDKWKSAIGLMSKEEAQDRLKEIDNINPDDFYTNGKKDWSKVVKNGNEHLAKSIHLKEGKVVDFSFYNDTAGYVYLVKSDIGLTKIGIAQDVNKRLNQINVNSPCDVELYYTCRVKDAGKLEKKLHKKFKNKRVKGEWFNLNSDDLQKCKHIILSYEWNN